MSGERAAFHSADGIALSGAWDSPGPGEAGVLLLPGYWRRAASPRIRELALALARRWPVLTLDFRGHGASSGWFTFGCREHLDVIAALEEMSRRGVRRAVIVGLSMGGASAIVTAGGSDALPVGIAALLAIAAPSDFGLIRPAPWRGRRDVAWADAWRLPRTSVPSILAAKRIPAEHVVRLPPELPVRLIHASGDWLVSHEHALRLRAASGGSAELLLIDERGAHADELLARVPSLMLRVIRPFVEAALHEGQAPESGHEEDPARWLPGLREALAAPARWSPDLGGLPLAGEIRDARAVRCRDGAHLCWVSGDEVGWARGLRDGSVHGVNLLANQAVSDGVAWTPALRQALCSALGAWPRQAPRWRLKRRGRDGHAALLETDEA